MSARTLVALALLAATATPAFGQPWCCFRLEVDPPNPLESTPVTVTVAMEFGDTCFEVCDVTGKWIGPSLFHIDWYIRDTHPGFCLRVVTTRSSELPLRLLEPGEYQVTATSHMTGRDAPCTEGTLFDQTETTFGVNPCIPTVSAWGLLVMALLLLAAGTICLRRRARRVALCAAVMLTSGVLWAGSSALGQDVGVCEGKGCTEPCPAENGCLDDTDCDLGMICHEVCGPDDCQVCVPSACGCNPITDT